jgi:hypothetical protein
MGKKMDYNDIPNYRTYNNNNKSNREWKNQRMERSRPVINTASIINKALLKTYSRESW